MENNLKFNSAICTSRVQSERLIALGLKKETADMVYHSYGYIIDEFGNKERRFKQPTIRNFKDYEGKHDIPAWSLHRIMSLINSEEWNTEITLKDGQYIIYYGYDVKLTEGPYDVLIDAIEYQITVGVFNKEYLV